MSTKNNQPTESVSIETKMNTLRDIVTWFESEDFVLEEATDKYKQAADLARDIEHDLDELKNTVTVIKESFEAK